MTRQTLLLTYMEAFRIVGVFFLFCVPLLLLMRKPSRGAGAPAGPAPDATAMH